MTDKTHELAAEKETTALKKLQAAAGFVDKAHVERLDWMYEQSSLSKPDDEKLMNMPVAAQKDQDLQDVKNLQESTAGSLFLKSATKTTEDMLRKLREDPLFQIRRQEAAAKESMMANPLVVAKLKKKAEKQAKKLQKKAKKAEKKQKKAMKKLAKAQGKLQKKKKKKSSSSSSDSDDSDSGSDRPPACHEAARARRSRSPPRREQNAFVRDEAPTVRNRVTEVRRSRSPARRERNAASPLRRRESSARNPDEGLGPTLARNAAGELRSLGPSDVMVSKREEYAAEVAKRKDAALSSRGAPRRMDEEEKKRRLAQMRADADLHERSKDVRIANAERRDQDIEEMEKQMRNNSDQKYFKEVRKEVYMGDSSGNVADRLRNQRHRRQKNLNDPLERDT